MFSFYLEQFHSGAIKRWSTDENTLGAFAMFDPYQYKAQTLYLQTENKILLTNVSSLLKFNNLQSLSSSLLHILLVCCSVGRPSSFLKRFKRQQIHLMPLKQFSNFKECMVGNIARTCLQVHFLNLMIFVRKGH